MNILEKIIAHKRTELAEKAETKALQNFDHLPAPRNFFTALKIHSNQPALIAEIKRASPSKGDLLPPDIDITEIADLYEKNGVAAMSVLTDEHFFRGKLSDIETIRGNFSGPVLRKDFILQASQIYEARAAGADAVLLMVSVLRTQKLLEELLDVTRSLGMEALVETHSAEEIEIAVAAGARVIGVNARNFSDLSVDISIFAELLPLIPSSCVRVAESGIYNAADIEDIRPYCDAILVGSSIMEAGLENIPRKISELRKNPSPQSSPGGRGSFDSL